MADLFNSSNPLTYLLILAALGAVGKLVHWLWKLARWTQKVDHGEANFRAFVEEIKDDIRKIQEQITDIFKRLPDPFATGSSPLQLTDTGKEVAQKLEAHRWAKELAPTLVNKVEDKQPFEIDDFSDTCVKDRLGERWEQRVAETAYELGRKSADVLVVLRVVLRNELLRLTGQTGPPRS